MSTRNVLLVKPGHENVCVVDIAKVGMAAALGCARIERWPYQYQLDTVTGSNGVDYRFDIWIDEEGALKGEEVNHCASIAAHPYNELNGPMICGNALLVPLRASAEYGLGDWAAVCDGVWVQCDCDSEDGTCHHYMLLEGNLAGPLAIKARCGNQ